MSTENASRITEKDAALALNSFLLAAMSATALGALLSNALSPNNASDAVWAGLMAAVKPREEEIAKNVAAFKLDENARPSEEMLARIKDFVRVEKLPAPEKIVALKRFAQSFGSDRWIAWQSEELWWGRGSVAESLYGDMQEWPEKKRRAHKAARCMSQFEAELRARLSESAPLEFRAFDRVVWQSLIEREKAKEELFIHVGVALEVEARLGWLPATLDEFFSDELLGRMAEQKDTAFRLTPKSHALIEAEILRRAARAARAPNERENSLPGQPAKPAIRL